MKISNITKAFCASLGFNESEFFSGLFRPRNKKIETNYFMWGDHGKLSFISYRNYILMNLIDKKFVYYEDNDESYISLKNQYLSSVILSALEVEVFPIGKILELSGNLHIFQSTKICRVLKIGGDVRLYFKNDWYRVAIDPVARKPIREDGFFQLI